VRDAVSLGRLRHPLPTFAVGERSAQVASLNANVDCRQLPEHTWPPQNWYGPIGSNDRR